MNVWHAGRVVDSSALHVPISDRVFEHGLGLFETFRTWEGVPVFLPRHLARLSASAEALGIPLDSGMLPEGGAVAALLTADEFSTEAMLRITLTGGTGNGSTLWMRASPLPPPTPPGGISVVMCPWAIAEGDPLARHKTLNYWMRRLAFEDARSRGADEALMATADGRIWEGSRTNLFVVSGDRLVTPPLSGPVLPGVMRAAVLAAAIDMGLEVVEAAIEPGELESAGEVFLTNSVRGVMPLRTLSGGQIASGSSWGETLSRHSLERSSRRR